MEAIRERLKSKNISHDVGPTAAVYCSAILQYLTSKVITEAVKSSEFVNQNESESPTKQAATLTGKRQRSDDEEQHSEQQPVPPCKKRRICPKDITRALQTDSTLKEFAHLIQVADSANPRDRAQQATDIEVAHHDNSFKLINCNEMKRRSNHLHLLDGVIIAFEANFEVSRTSYAEELKRALEAEYVEQIKTEQMYRQLMHHSNHKGSKKKKKHDDDDDDEEEEESDSDNDDETDVPTLIGCVLRENACHALNAEFVANPSAYCLTWLYHLSTIVSQQLHFAATNMMMTMGGGHGAKQQRFVMMNRSPIGLLSMAMLFMNKKWLNTAQFRLYLNSHSTQLFPACYRPDITVFIVRAQQNENNKHATHHRRGERESVLRAQDRLLMDDFLFELLIQKIASRKYGKFVFLAEQQMKGSMPRVSRILVDVLQNKHEVCQIFWESDLKAFNNTQNPNIVNPNRRIIYNQERQIAEGLHMMQRGELAKCDVVYIHISLWMKPKQHFKPLILAHLTRFESICFYALRHHDLDERAKQIVHWIFTDKHT